MEESRILICPVCMAEFDLDYNLGDENKKVFCPSCDTEIPTDDITLKELMFDENAELEEDYVDDSLSSYEAVDVAVEEDTYDDDSL